MRGRIVSWAWTAVSLFGAVAAAAQATAGDSHHDAISGNFASIGIDPSWIDMPSFRVALDTLEGGGALIWKGGSTGGTELYDIGVLALPDATEIPITCGSNTDPKQVYLFHIARWKNTGTDSSPAAQLISSAWYVYRYSRFHSKKDYPQLVPVRLNGSGDPLIYGAKRALVLSLDVFAQPDNSGQFQSALGTLQVVNSVALNQGTPENMTNLGTILGAFAGVAKSTQMAAGSGPKFDVYAAGICQEGTSQLPFDLAITESAASETQKTVTSFTAAGDRGGGGGDKSKQAPAATSNAAACTGSSNSTPCTMTRTFTSKDREFWDVSGGLAIPGVRETNFSFSTSGSSGSTTTSTTRHTEAYAFVDLFPFWLIAPKDSWFPHLNTGIPITSKSLYRPYFGLAESLTGPTGLQKKLNLPVAINFTAGACYMKTEEILGSLPTTEAEFKSSLKWHRVWKPMFGVEIPVGSVISKIGGKSSSSGGAKSK
jgi:hypothetical protein